MSKETEPKSEPGIDISCLKQWCWLTYTAKVSHKSDMTSVDWSNDGKYIATGSEGRHICLIDAQVDEQGKLKVDKKGELQQIWRKDHHASRVTCVQFSPDSSRLVTASKDRTTCIVDVNGGGLIWRIDSMHTSVVQSSRWSPRGSDLVTASWDGRVCMVKLPVFKSEQVLFKHKNHVRSVAWHGKCLVSGSRDGTVKALDWDGALDSLATAMQDSASHQVDNSASEQVYCGAFKLAPPAEPLNSELAISTVRGGIKVVAKSSCLVLPIANQTDDALAEVDDSLIYSQENCRPTQEHDGSCIYCLAWAPEIAGDHHDLLASGAESGAVVVQHCPRSGEETSDTSYAVYGPTENLFISGLQEEQKVAIGAATAVAWSPNIRRGAFVLADVCRQLAVGTSSYLLILDVNDAADRAPQISLKMNLQIPEDAGVNAVAWSANGDRLAAGCLDSRVRIFRTDTWESVWNHKYDGPVYAVAWCPRNGLDNTSTFLAAGGTNASGFNQVCILDVGGALTKPHQSCQNVRGKWFCCSKTDGYQPCV